MTSSVIILSTLEELIEASQQDLDGVAHEVSLIKDVLESLEGTTYVVIANRSAEGMREKIVEELEKDPEVPKVSLSVLLNLLSHPKMHLT